LKANQSAIGFDLDISGISSKSSQNSPFKKHNITTVEDGMKADNLKK
jgi:hypothetical protein